MENKELDKSEQALIEEENNTSVEHSENTSVVKRPRGRPPGAKNKTTIFKEAMVGEFQNIAEKEVPAVLEKLFEKAKGGDIKAIKIVMDKLVAPARSEDDTVKKGGITVNISVGSMEAAQAIDIEDAEYEEID